MAKPTEASAGGLLALLLTLINQNGPAVAAFIQALLAIFKPQADPTRAYRASVPPEPGSEATDPRVMAAVANAEAAGVSPDLISFVLRALATNAMALVEWLEQLWKLWSAPPPVPPPAN